MYKKYRLRMAAVWISTQKKNKNNKNICFVYCSSVNIFTYAFFIQTNHNWMRDEMHAFIKTFYKSIKQQNILRHTDFGCYSFFGTKHFFFSKNEIE